MPERSEYLPGTFSWIDCATTDQEGAKAFYSSLFGWSFMDMPVPALVNSVSYGNDEVQQTSAEYMESSAREHVRAELDKLDAPLRSDSAVLRAKIEKDHGANHEHHPRAVARRRELEADGKEEEGEEAAAEEVRGSSESDGVTDVLDDGSEVTRKTPTLL